MSDMDMDSVPPATRPACVVDLESYAGVIATLVGEWRRVSEFDARDQATAERVATNLGRLAEGFASGGLRRVHRELSAFRTHELRLLCAMGICVGGVMSGSMAELLTRRVRDDHARRQPASGIAAVSESAEVGRLLVELGSAAGEIAAGRFRN